MHLARDSSIRSFLIIHRALPFRRFFSLLLDRGHGPRLNAILTGRRAHHLTDISLYESDNGIPPPLPPLPPSLLREYTSIFILQRVVREVGEQIGWKED